LLGKSKKSLTAGHGPQEAFLLLISQAKYKDDVAIANSNSEPKQFWFY